MGTIKGALRIKLPGIAAMPLPDYRGDGLLHSAGRIGDCKLPRLVHGSSWSAGKRSKTLRIRYRRRSKQ